MSFPTFTAGGFLCVLDNLELLETSQRARTLLESLRDSVLNRPGLRWVLCGARGIMRGSASSARLSGRLAQPMDLEPIPERIVPEVIDRRVQTFREGDKPYVPVEAKGFELIYEIVHRNLRSALNYCEQFAFWLYTAGKRPASADERIAVLIDWLKALADQYVLAAADVTKRQWKLFDHLAGDGGSCSPSDFSRYGFNSSMAMRPHIKALEDANLLLSTIDEDDKRRKTIGLTANGWLVRYQRSGYKAAS